MFDFSRDQKALEVRTRLRRVADLTTPSFQLYGDCHRTDPRTNRTLPVLLTAWRKGKPLPEVSATAVTKNVSDRGIALVVRHPIESGQLVVTFWLGKPHVTDPEPEPWYFLANVRQCVDIGGGFWQLGLEISDHLDSRRVRKSLRPLAEALLPSSSAHSEMAETAAQ